MHPPSSPAAEERWVRTSVAALLAATAVLYVWGLGSSHWANGFYSAAAQAGGTSWKAMFFGSSDAANAITVDKTPAALWVMDLSVRIFGVNPWSILVPQALEGVAAVGLLYGAVRRWASPAAGLVAGAVLALSPAAALMFRFNNPDALLVLTLTASAYAIVRAVDSGSTWWVAAAGALVGVSFMAKMLQALLVVPALGTVYLLAGPPPTLRRIRQLVLGAVAMVVAGGWWVVTVQLIPASARPYIGGSQRNSVLDLMFGYNGFGRLTGREVGSVGGRGPAGNRWGLTGWNRLFGAQMGTQISWLIPAALLLGAAALLCTLGAGRADRTRAGVVLWGGWLLVTGIAFSFGHGIIHPYYTSALGPALGALVGIGGWSLWTRRSNRWARAALAVTLGVTAGWSAVLLRRTPSWNPVLVPIVVITGLAVGAAMLVGPLRRGRWAPALASTAVVVALVGPGAYTLATAATPHEGAIPTAGPTIKTPPRLPLLPVVAPAAALASQRASQRLSQRLGGLLNISLPRNTLRDHLLAGRPRSRWILAVARSEVAAGYQLATRRPVLAIGGFNGTDPFPTLRQFVAMVQRGEIRWFIATRPGRIPGRNKPANQISRWVIEHFTRERVGGVWIYDLTRPAPS